MTKNFVKRIIDAYYNHYNAYAMAGYTYQYNACDGCIRRIKSDDIGRMWIDSDGERYDGWTVYATPGQITKILERGC